MGTKISGGALYAGRALRTRGAGDSGDSRGPLGALRTYVACRSLYASRALRASRTRHASDAR